MNAELYKKFQQFQNDLFFFVDSKYIADSNFGNVLFQQMANSAFEVFSKFEIEPPQNCSECKKDE